jgi:hypothetical protein
MRGVSLFGMHGLAGILLPFACAWGGRSMTTSHMPNITGWQSFAGIVAFVVGVFNVIDGLVALLRSDYYLVTSQDLLVFNFTAWGWIWLILGIALIAIGWGILADKTWARAAGVVLAVLVAIGHLAFLRAFPVWSVIVIAMCMLVIYGLTTRART